ncbi:hypothetical protein ANANG_G00282150 [Anguilla anguilla]|uniref:Striated muscle preferentially expressed protein kinase-like n=1 Tax=Anguilla anguilla TaxID=7936 RepID=A0A9D3LNQ7_ANGAN|nr:hypothetical protein ANANG_G00282150 [Anguilla anguilla]
MKKIWSKKRFQKTGHSSRTFGRFTHAPSDSQFSTGLPPSTEHTRLREHGGRSGGTPDTHAEQRGACGASGSSCPPSACRRQRPDDGRDGGRPPGSRTDSWAGSPNTVVEKEAPALGSRAPVPQDPSKPARSQSEDVLREAHPQVLPPPSPKIGQRSITSPITTRSGSAPGTPLTPRKKVVVPSDYVDTLARASSKIFEKVRVFEERRKSIDNPEGSISGRSWAGFNRAASIDSDDGGSRLGISRESSREDLREALKADAAERRSMFRQRAASLEDRPRYSQKVQDIESKFTEELRRIKKLVGKPHLAKSFSTEQLSHRSRQPLRKVEPIPPQVLQKLQIRERIQQEEEEKRREQLKERSPQRSPEPEKKQEAQKNEEESPPQQPETSKSSVNSVTISRFGEKEITPEALSVTELPGQRLSRQPARSSPVREPPQSSLTTQSPGLAEEELPPPPPPKEEPSPRKVEISVRQVERRPPSPLVQRRSPFAHELARAPDSPVKEALREEPAARRVGPSLRKVEQRPPSPLVQREPRIQEHTTQAPPKPPRLSKPSSPAHGSVPEQEGMEVQAPPASPAPKLPIPTIVVEEEPMEVQSAEEAGSKPVKKSREGATHRARGKGHRTRPMSPELESSDDSYVSAGEDPLEAPMFELPLQDTVASAGTDILLACIIAGTPYPEVTWRKEDDEIRNSATHTVKVEGERHSLLIKRAKPSDAGTYRATATNEVGRATCTATLFIQADSRQEPRGTLSVPMDISSPITSDEEYLSPMEEGLDYGGPSYRGPEPRKIVDARFRETPSFQMTLSDQVVTEGQAVTMCVRMQGQPKPMIYWLRDRVTIKTAGRHIVREAEDGTFEMKITSAQRSDMGVYTCKIINEYGSKQCECKLEVKAAPREPVVVITQHVRDMTRRECHMSGPQDVDVDWLSDGKLIQPALLNCKMHFDGRRCRLLLNSVHEDDSGTYTCKLSTAKEELTSSANLKVIPSIPPLFTRKLDVLEVIEGRTARFDCKVSGTPPPRVSWSHFERTLADSENVRILKEGGRHSLLIVHVTNENEGFYTVTARNAHGEAECAAELYVQEPRPAISSQMAKLEKMPSIPEEPEMADSEVERFTMPDFVKPLYDLDVVEGKEAVLKCKVAGLPYPTITWFHNGKKIDTTDERKMAQYRDIHSLVIRSVCHAHGGVYKSVISNKVGKAACYAHLYVADVLPDPPDGAPVIEGVTGKTVTLSWRKPKRLDPSLDASSLMYAIQQQALGSVQWTIIASGLRQTSYTVASLSKGVRYSFRVLSTVSKTFSKPSPPTEPVQLLDRGPYLREAPVIVDKPDVVYVVENQSVSITVTLNHVQAAVTWKKQDVLLEHRPGVFEMSMPDDDQHTLKMVRMRSSDVGQIICMATNQHGSDSCILTLEMAVPPTFESIMEDMDVQVGETPRFAVVVEGKPVPDIMWYKNDTLLSDSSHFTFVYDDNECSLVILNIQEEDSGVYTCTAKNLAGVVSCKAELTVHTGKTPRPAEPAARRVGTRGPPGHDRTDRELLRSSAEFDVISASLLRAETEEAMEDEETVLRKMRRLTDYYDIHKEIGRGAFSYVKRVTEKEGKAEFAAKFMSARAKKKTSALREMNLLSRLDHQRIVYFHDAFEKKNAVIVITELCHEEFLDKLTKKSSITESEIRSIMRQLLEGVGYLHQNNIMHLDIKPENILMADPSGEQIRICDFGNAMEITPDEAQYCKYGTPEFVAPEIVNQTPVSKASDIWPIGVMTYLCLTGVSPFAGENDRSTVLNIRSYNVAFEESMFAGLCREAKGFVIKLLVAERLRPDANECLRHPWFKMLTKGKSISAESLKPFLSRRKWQRSLISYKSKMVMRSIPELLDDSSNHISIAVPRHLKEGSPPASSSSDSDEDIDELPFIPMPHIMDFSGSRMSLTEIPGDEEVAGRPNGTVEGVGQSAQGVMLMECEPSEKDGGETVGRGRARKRATQEEGGGSSDEETAEAAKRPDQPKRPLRRGSSMESEKGEGVRRKGELRRGSSADSALLLHIKPEEGAGEEAAEDGRKVLKKAVSMELPRRSPSPGAGKMSQEDYALKLELMRQRLLRGGSVDNKMSGLRGPLLETLGMSEEKRYSSLDRYVRPSRLAVPPLTRAASSDSPRDETPKTKVLRKSASFSQGDAEPIPLHRRSGAPLEIPLAQIEERRLQEAPSMSALTEQPRLDSRPVTPKDLSKPPTPDLNEQELQISGRMKRDSSEERERKMEEDQAHGVSGQSDTMVLPEKKMSMLEEEREEEATKECESVSERVSLSEMTPSTMEKEEKQGKVKDEREEENFAIRIKDEEEMPLRESPEITITTSSVTHISPSPPARVTLPDGRTSAYASIMQTIMVPSLQPANAPTPASTAPTVAPTPTPTPTLSQPEPPSWTEHPAVFSRVASTEQLVKEPSPTKTSTLPSLPREPSPGRDIKDITSEEVFQSRFKKRESSLTRSLKLLTRSKAEEKPSVEADSAGEEIYRPGPIGAPLEFSRRLEEKSKSVQDLREASKDSSFMKRLSMRLKRTPSAEKIEEPPAPEPGVPRRRLSWGMGRSKTQDKKEVEMVRLDGVSEPRQEEEAKETKKTTESPVLAMRKKIESTVAGISMRIRSHSMDRKEEKNAEDKEAKPESKRTPLLSILRRTSSEGVNLKKMGQSSTTTSTESLESMSSVQSETSTKTATDSERRSRWDRWGLTRGRRDKTVSQPDIPSAIARENGSLRGRQYSRLASDFPPVFHIKLRDHVLLEGDPVTLSCLPAGSPHPHITWMKDKNPLEIDPRMNMISCPDGRQLLMIMKTTKKGRQPLGL